MPRPTSVRNSRRVRVVFIIFLWGAPLSYAALLENQAPFWEINPVGASEFFLCESLIKEFLVGFGRTRLWRFRVWGFSLGVCSAGWRPSVSPIGHRQIRMVVRCACCQS